MIRTFNGSGATSLANDPLVRPLLGGEGYVDLGLSFSDPRNFAFCDGGYTVCMPLYPGAYEAHTIAYPSGARYTIRRTEAVRDYMFVHTGCEVILTKCPDSNPGTARIAERAGFVQEFHREDALGPGLGASYWKLTLDRWALACSTAAEQGQAFHALLEKIKRDSGSELPVHSEDTVHDHVVGASVMMIKAGNVVKGVDFYNKWAIFAGYGQIGLLSETPVLIDIQDALMGLRDGQVEVLQCR